MACVPTVPTTSVWPSGALLATKSAPMLPPAPGLLSTVIGWPSEAHFSARMRASVSGAPPGVKVTTMRMGLVGQAACWAVAAVAASPRAASAMARRVNIRCLLVCLGGPFCPARATRDTGESAGCARQPRLEGRDAGLGAPQDQRVDVVRA